MLALLPALLLPLAEKAPEPEDVKAGWVAFAVFAGLILAVVVLAFSLVKQLRKTEAARRAGVFGDVPETDEQSPGPRGS